ncbi:hypothetical protein [Alkalihalobacterium bogoriense]|uniref:hypothetical protein n=1 Tax=Alkalihalobacterium bogoriense TaxID=246272 RepID=UPI00054E7D58|nr:hypothetical protein [Alkalihalobacterium bogoriense]
MGNELFFKDNFFSAGLTDIYNEKKEKIGSLDLKSAFSSKVDIVNLEGEMITSGFFPVFSAKWKVVDYNENELGVLRQRMTFFSKKFEYLTKNQVCYTIHSEAFSKEYEINNQKGEVVAHFKRINGFFESPAFKLVNSSEVLTNEELITVVMGVNMITKRNNSSSHTTHGHTL